MSRQKLKTYIKNIFIAVFLLSTTLYIFTTIYVFNRVNIDNREKSDVIIVLGAKSFVDGAVNKCVEARVKHAIELYNDGFGKKIIMSGGTDKKPVFQNTDEAREMKKIALSLDSDIDEQDILIEGESTSTYENLLYSKEIMGKNNYKSAIIVTEPFHSPRANLVASKLNINHTISPTRSSPCWNNSMYFSKYFLREPFVLIGYKLLNQI